MDVAAFSSCVCSADTQAPQSSSCECAYMSCVQLLFLVRIQHVWLERIVFRASCGGVRSYLSIAPNGTSGPC